jgi:hypothetical protein
MMQFRIGNAFSREPHKEIALDAVRQRPTLGMSI